MPVRPPALTRPPTASEVQVMPVSVQLPIAATVLFDSEQMTSNSTATTGAGSEWDPSAGDPAGILPRLSQVDRKLDEMMGLMRSCLDGIDRVKLARAQNSEDEDDNDSSENSRPSTGQGAHRSERGDEDDTEAGVDSEALQPSLHVGSAWAQPAAPAAPAPLVPIKSSSRVSFGAKSGSESEASPARGRGGLLELLDKAFRTFNARGPRKDAVWELLEDSDSSWGAKVWTRTWCAFVCAAVLLTLSQTLGSRAPVSGTAAVVLETIIEVAFLAEVIARSVVCPDMKHYLTSAFNLIDVASATPLALRMAKGFSQIDGGDVRDPVEFTLLCVVPVIRLLKIFRHQHVQLLLFEAMVDSVMETLQFLGFVGICIVLTFAAVIFLLEPRDNIESYAHACWLTIVTMTTVGYGDVAPVTDAGRMAISVLVVCSALYMAIPIGVLGNAFAAVWKDRDLILLIDKTRRTLSQWGYTGHDIPIIFRRFDIDGDGELDLSEFRIMMKELRMNLKEERLVELFEIFDKDRGGSVDDKEFLHVVFPGAWHDMVQKEKEEEEAREEERERKQKERRERRRRSVLSGENLGLSPSSRTHGGHESELAQCPVESYTVHDLVEGDKERPEPQSNAPSPAPPLLLPGVAAPQLPCPTTTVTTSSFADKGNIQSTNPFAFSKKDMHDFQTASFLAFSEAAWTHKLGSDMLVDEA